MLLKSSGDDPRGYTCKVKLILQLYLILQISIACALSLSCNGQSRNRSPTVALLCSLLTLD